MSQYFGDFLSQKRKEKGLTLRSIADKINLSASYISDIEKGRRNPPEINLLENLAEILSLTDEEKILFFDMAGEARNEISPDLPEYIMDTPIARTALRKARDSKADDKMWEDFIAIMDSDEEE